ncbi:hypothetical protein [Paenibacillus massiliensis]|uniref:hypothetical protein n=1 Tax=Paenibacillus massiliensis TaxID=225917 RepID=UPI0004723D80|nr:hypothetical protein [Paenibacillus massiliensis]
MVPNVEKAKEELSKYFGLKHNRAEMFSPYIDEVWHDLIENKPEEYVDLSISSCGVVVGHIEKPKGSPRTEEIFWVKEYHEKHGDLPSIWFTDKDGNVDEQVYSEYKKSKRVIIKPQNLLGPTTCFCDMFLPDSRLMEIANRRGYKGE